VHRIAALAATAVLLTTACGSTEPSGAATQSPSPPAPASAPGSEATSPTASTPPVPTRGKDLATGLEVPWGVAVMESGDLLVADRLSGRVVQVAADGSGRRTLGTVPDVAPRGEGGLLGLAVRPGDDTTLYAYLTTRGDNRVVRIPLTLTGLGRPAVVLAGIPAGSVHNGGRIAFGPDGKLWVTTGDAGIRELAQDRASLAGKVLRLEQDGGIPADNPFDTPVWSWGHRNVQGIAWDSAGQAWATEFGSSEADELNLIRKGANYGWPEVEGVARDARFEDPAVTWRTDEASPSGLAIVDDVAYVAALRGQRLWQVPLRGAAAGEPVARLEGVLGRVRTVEPLAGGGLVVTTSNRDGRGDPRPGDDRLVEVRLTG
jgi:glucose/arabinose dehydrogenase